MSEAEPRSPTNSHEVMAVSFGLKAFCSSRSDSPYLRIFEQYNNY